MMMDYWCGSGRSGRESTFLHEIEKSRHEPNKSEINLIWSDIFVPFYSPSLYFRVCEWRRGTIQNNFSNSELCATKDDKLQTKIWQIELKLQFRKVFFLSLLCCKSNKANAKFNINNRHDFIMILGVIFLRYEREMRIKKNSYHLFYNDYLLKRAI